MPSKTTTTITTRKTVTETNLTGEEVRELLGLPRNTKVTIYVPHASWDLESCDFTLRTETVKETIE